MNLNNTTVQPPKTPPAWFVHTAWRVHRLLYRLSRGRFLWTTSNKRGWGAMRLTTTGRKSGQERSVIIGYIEDGPNLVTLAMNGWDEGHPAWWLNLEAHAVAVVRLANQHPRQVHARLATGQERDRLWQRWVETDPNLLANADHRATTTPVVVLEPADAAAPPNRVSPSGRTWKNVKFRYPCSGVAPADDPDPAGRSRSRRCAPNVHCGSRSPRQGSSGR